MPRSLRIVLIVVAVAISAWFMSVYTRGSNPLYGDALSYYTYLPAALIYDNLDSMYNVPSDRGIPEGIHYDVHFMERVFPKTPKGYVLNQYTYGVALMELPFFLLAHAYEKLTGGQANGYSDSYEYALYLSAMVYALLGLLFTYLSLKQFFSKTWSFVAVLLIFLGTNLFWFVLRQVGMAHVPIFFLVAALVWLTIKVHEEPKLRYFLLTGLILGIITLIRPTDLIFGLIPLLYGVYNVATLKEKIRFLRAHFGKVLLFILALMLPIVPQLLYWKWMTGEYVYYSYGTQTFNWARPRIFSGLLYCNNGWLAYTPIMAFALLGMMLFRHIRAWAWGIWLIFPVYVYVIYSWYCYNYINGLGSRPMIHLYPLLAVPFTAFMVFIAGRGKIMTTAFIAVCIFLCAINISYSRQQALGILASDESNFAYNKSIFFRTTNTYEDLLTYDLAETQPDEKKLTRMPIKICNDYDDSLSAAHERDTVHHSRYWYRMPSEQEHLHNPIRIIYSRKQFQEARWLKCSGDFMVPEVPSGYGRHLFQVAVKRVDTFVKWKAVEIQNKLDVWNSKEPGVLEVNRVVTDMWGHIWFYIKLPEDIQDGDLIELSLWNVGKQPIYMDNMCLEAFK